MSRVPVRHTITPEQKRELINYPEPGWVERTVFVACKLPTLIKEPKQPVAQKRHYERTNHRGSSADVGV